MANYRPTDGSFLTLTVPFVSDAVRAHNIELTAEYMAADSSCGQSAGWYFEAANIVRGQRRRAINLSRDLEDELMQLFESFVSDMTEPSF